jgi:hypothetical protein
MCKLGSIFLCLLLSGDLRSGFFLGGCRGLTLLHATAHRASDGSRGSTGTGIACNGANRRSTGGPARSAPRTTAFGRVCIVGSSFLLSLFLFSALTGWRGSLGVYPGLLSRGAVTLALVFELLVWGLAVPSEDKYSNVF